MATVTRYVNTNSTPGGDGTTNATSGANRAFASQNEAEASLQRTTSDVIRIICDGTAVDTTAVTYDGWTVSSPGYISVEGASSHGGKWNTSKYRMEVAGNCILIREQFVRLEGLQLATDSSSTTQYSCVEFDSNLDSDTRGYVSKCILKNKTATTGKRYGVWLDSNNGKYYLSNNIFYDFTGHANSSAIRNALELTEAYAYHNTMCGNNAGWYTVSGVTLCRLSNNLFQDNTNSIVNTSATSFHSSSNYNVCDDNGTGNNLVPGANSIKSTEITFTDEAGKDFHTADTNAQVSNNLYSDANLPISVDVDGDARPSSGSVYAGADEHVSSGPVTYQDSVALAIYPIIAHTQRCYISTAMALSVNSGIGHGSKGAATESVVLNISKLCELASSFSARESLSIGSTLSALCNSQTACVGDFALGVDLSIEPSALAITQSELLLQATYIIANNVACACLESLGLSVAKSLAISAKSHSSDSVTLDLRLPIAFSDHLQAEESITVEVSLDLSHLLSLESSANVVAFAELALGAICSQVYTAHATALDALALQISDTLSFLCRQTLLESLSLDVSLAANASVGVSATDSLSILVATLINASATALGRSNLSLDYISGISVSGRSATVTLTLPDGRTLTVTAETRLIAIGTEERILVVPTEKRILDA